jgi:hypothetical protein
LSPQVYCGNGIWSHAPIGAESSSLMQPMARMAQWQQYWSHVAPNAAQLTRPSAV